MRNLYPRESVEFQPVSVSVNGTAVTTNVEFAITERLDDRLHAASITARRWEGITE